MSYKRGAVIFLAGLATAFSVCYFAREEENVDGIKQELSETKQQIQTLNGLYQLKKEEAQKYKDSYKHSLNTLKENSLMIDSLNHLQLEILYEEQCHFDEDSLYYNLKINRFQ